MYKEQKGITLVALVITIIVLLILAGVTIAALSGPNGILTNSTKAKQDTAVAEAREAVTMAINTIVTNKYANATEDNTLNATTLANVIRDNYPDIEFDDGDVTATQAILTVSGIEVKVTIASSGDNANVWKVTDAAVDAQ